jgi:hypothetical protein
MGTIQAALAAVRDQLLGGAWGPLARGLWCRKQRGVLEPPGHRVVWVSREALPWAEWGAARGYFTLDRMDGVPYLMRALAAPAA